MEEQAEKRRENGFELVEKRDGSFEAWRRGKAVKVCRSREEAVEALIRLGEESQAIRAKGEFSSCYQVEMLKEKP